MTSEERFGFEWDEYEYEGIVLHPQYKEQFDKWTSLLPREYFKGKEILDAGCGNGRNSFFAQKYGAKFIHLFDNNKILVIFAKRNLEEYKDHSSIFKESIYNIDYKNKFDLVMCIGVIHHLEYPKKAITNLVRASKGKILVWVYGYEGNEWIMKYINPIRKITSKLPITLTRFVTYVFSIPLYSYIKLLPHKKPYMKQLKGFRFKYIHSIAVDQLSPKIANYYTKQEALDLFKDQNVKNVQIEAVNDNSWQILAEKRQNGKTKKEENIKLELDRLHFLYTYWVDAEKIIRRETISTLGLIYSPVIPLWVMGFREPAILLFFISFIFLMYSHQKDQDHYVEEQIEIKKEIEKLKFK